MNDVLRESWDEIVGFNDAYFGDWRHAPLPFLTNALAGEAGELCNSAKHLIGGGTHQVAVDQDMLLAEAADVFVYLALIVEWVAGGDGLTANRFAYAIRKKMQVNRERMEARKAATEAHTAP